MKNAAAIFLLAAAVAVACGAVQAQELAPPPVVDPIAPDVAAARFKEIDRDRAELQKAQTAEEAACYQKFAVNGCLLDTRARYRPKLTELRHRELAVRAGERRRMEDERQVRMAEQLKNEQANQAKAAERAGTASPAQRQAEADQRQADRAAALPGQVQQAQSQQAQAQAAHAKEAASVAQRAADAPAQRSRYTEKQKAAAERRAAQARRAQEKAAKPPSQPLPDPPAR
jgi:colicin import membrane protein